jgi:hypothetical protein
MSASTWRDLITVLTDGSPDALEEFAAATDETMTEELADAGLDVLLEAGAIAYLDWRDPPDEVLDAARRLAPWLDLGDVPRTPEHWTAEDEDELALPAVLGPVAGRLPAGMVVLDLGIDADGHAITATSAQRTAAALPLLERLGLDPRVHDGADGDLERAVAAVTRRHGDRRSLQRQVRDHLAAGMAQRGFTSIGEGDWARPFDLPRTRLRVKTFLEPRVGGQLDVHPSISVETEGLQSLMPRDSGDAWTSRLAEKEEHLLLHPFLEPEYVHPDFVRVRVPGRGEDLTTYRLRVRAEEPWREQLDAYLFENLDEHLPPLLARLSTPEGLARWAPAHHHGGPFPMPHLFRASSLMVAVLGRADLVEEAIAAYADPASLGPRDSLEDVAAFAAWVRAVPRERCERFVQGGVGQEGLEPPTSTV